jgi:hypothetical protein
MIFLILKRCELNCFNIFINKIGVLMKNKLTFFVTIVFAAIVSNIVIAQTTSTGLQATLEKLSKDAASSYVSPIVSAFGSNLNGGWFHRAPQAKIWGIDIEFGIVAMGTFFNEDHKKFSTTGKFKFTKNEAYQLVPNTYPTVVRDAIVNELIKQEFGVGISGPTIVGANTDTIRIAFNGTTISTGGTSYTLPAKTIPLPVTGYLEELPALPLAAPQLTLGTVYGTSFTFRYLPAIEIDKDLGEFKYFGFGIMHNPGMWFPNPLPLEVAVGFFTQSMEVGKFFSTSATAFGIYASKTFGPGALNITPYAGLIMESSSIDVKYDAIIDDPVPNTPVSIAFELEGENSVRFTIGTSIKLGFINLNVDYNMAKYSSVTGGLNFIF